MPQTIEFTGERAYCPFYAIDPDLGFVAVSALTTAQELGLRVAARLVGGQAVPLEDGVILKRQREVEIPLPKKKPDDEEYPTTCYKAAYTRSHPLKLETGVGYETCVLHRDATMQAPFGHWGYLLRMPGGSDTHFRARFFHLWGRVTGLPARPGWVQSLWNMGLTMQLIVPLKTFGCQAWRIDPRWDRPPLNAASKPASQNKDRLAGWREVLKILVQTKENKL